jgi:hypothetical protein
LIDGVLRRSNDDETPAGCRSLRYAMLPACATNKAGIICFDLQPEAYYISC